MKTSSTRGDLKPAKAISKWRCRTAWYDAVAETYDRLAVPHVFTQPAKDLVAMLKLPHEAGVLDIGAGTGIAALLASKCLGPTALVVALDSSIGMLRLARKKGLRRLVVGVVPGLPFPDGVLDGALATFVLSHIPSYQTALSDVIRVLRPGGRLAVSAWGPRQSDFRHLWQVTAESFVSKEQLSRRLREALPWEDWFSDAGHLEEALRDAGFEGVEVHHREYKSSVTVDDFLSMREVTVQAKLMKELLETAQWESFRQQVANKFRNCRHGLVEDTRDAYLAVGNKPNT